MNIISDKLTIRDLDNCGSFRFAYGPSIPVYEPQNVHALNQLIGYAKFINRDCGTVYYRGQTNLYSTLLPSAFRNVTNVSSVGTRIGSTVNAIIADEKMKHELKLEDVDEKDAKVIVECLLQHYGLSTRYVDFVDNHWVALWMGLYKYQTITQINTYSRFVKRDPSPSEYQYILLTGFPTLTNKREAKGVCRHDSCIIVDLRQALPSTFLRPHAQHGLLARKIVSGAGEVQDHDLCECVIGILKISTMNAAEWLGCGSLLSQNNLFPPPSNDNGYDLLLSRNDLFSGEQQIAKYV